MSISTAGLVALVAGEDWHIVGSGGGEPAFATGWSNASATYYPKMAFRLREAGIVDLAGCVTYAGGGTTAIFTLPEGYRPVASHGIMPCIGQRSAVQSGQLLVVNDTGEVIATEAIASDIVYISGSFFTDSPTAIS